MTRSLSNMSLESMPEQLLFDAYSDNPSTKDCAHIRRSGGTIVVTVHFISSMALQTKKEEFLSNRHNIAFLSQRLEKAGCEIHQARGETDVLIVQTALIIIIIV